MMRDADEFGPALLLRSAADRDQGDLLEVWIVIILVGLAFGGWNLLKDCSGRHRLSEVLTVDFVKGGQVGEIVEVDSGRNDLIEVHVGFFQIVELVAHRLSKLMRGGRGIHAAVRAGDKAALGRAVKSVAGKNTGAGSGAGSHVFRADRLALSEISHRDT